MRRILATLGVVAALAVGLTGCEDVEPKEDSIDRGIRCVEAGGSWTWSEWSGYHCEFEGKG